MNNENNFGAARPGDSLEKGGLKYDLGKAEVQQGVFDYFPRALMEVANVSSYGARKYDWNGWQYVSDGYNRYANAGGRHKLLQGIDGFYDIGVGGSGLLHDAQEAWNALAKLEIGLRDGRYTSTRGFPLPEKNVSKAQTLDTPVDRILGGAANAGFKSFSDFEEQADVKAAAKPTQRLVWNATEVPNSEVYKLASEALGKDIRVISDPDEWYNVTGEAPPQLEPQFELTEMAKEAIKPRKAARAVRKPASRPKAAAKRAVPKPARKR